MMGGGPPQADARTLRALILVALLVGGAALGAQPLRKALFPSDAGSPASAEQAALDLIEGSGLSADVARALLQARSASWDFPAPSAEAGVLGPFAAFDPVPLPAPPAGDEPLLQVLSSRQVGNVGPAAPLDLAALRAQILGLRMAPETERAVAGLVLAFDEARRLQAEALAGVPEDVLALLALRPAAVDAWFAARPGAGAAEFESELAALVTAVDIGKNLQAADLLQRAVEAARPALALPPPPGPAASPEVPVLPHDPWDALEVLVRASLPDAAGPDPYLPRLPLGESLRLLAIASGGPDPGPVPVDGVPPGLADALSRIVAAQAFAMWSQDPLLGALALLEASRGAQPVLGAFGAWLDGVGALPAGTPLAGLPLDQLPAPLQGVADPSLPGLPAAQASTIPLPDADADGSPDALELLLGTDADDPGSRPFGGTHLPSVLGGSPGGPALQVGRPGADAAAPDLLVVGDVAGETVDREALVRIDLGGDDVYRVAVGTQRSFLLELGGSDTYDTPKLDHTQGSTTGLGAALLIDVSGHDTYRARDGSQGSACCGAGSDPGVAAPPDPAGAAAAAAGDPEAALWAAFGAVLAQSGKGAGGLGALADLEGGDTYQGRLRSQGYGRNFAVSAVHEQQSPGDRGRGFAGLLFDAQGADTYRFSTQGFAELDAAATFPDATEGGRPLGLFADAGGEDTYENTMPVDSELLPEHDTDKDRFFGTQGNARVESGGGIPNNGQSASPVGVFLEVGGNDTYVTATTQGTVTDAWWHKNNNQRTPPPPAINPTGGLPRLPVGVFLDAEPTQAQNALFDADRDGGSVLVEWLAGTDPNDPASDPGEIFGDDPGLQHSLLVRAPHLLGSVPVAGGLVALPGLAIAGHADSAFHETFDFFLDLGGNDTYLGAGHGGAALPPGDATVAGQPPAVRLAVDAGGNDTYRPAAVDLPAQGATRFASAPSLGGAHLGVSVLADLGGRNTFDLNLSVAAAVPTGSSGEAIAGAWGVGMGAGLLGGVGVLVTHDASSRFNATAVAQADDFDEVPKVTATAYAASQGAGFLGVGVLAAYGGGDDHYEVHSRTILPASGDVTDRVTGLGQGASFGGVGVLLDAGGANGYLAPEGFAQGVGWGVASLPGTAPPFGNLDNGAVLLNTALGVGVLAGGDGPDRLDAAGPAQGVGGAFLAPEHGVRVKYDDTRASRFRGGAGVGMLLGGAGDDAYAVAAPSRRLANEWQTTAVLAQGAATPDSLGLLADTAGNDRYSAGGPWAQAASIGGAAFLVDLDGHDAYAATDRSQGFAQAALLAATREGVCLYGFMLGGPVPCNPALNLVSPQANQRGSQALAEAVPQGAAAGVLLDVEGLDSYKAGHFSQGFATDQSDSVLRAAVCRGHDAGERNLAVCPPPPDPRPGQVVLPGSPNGNREFIPTEPVGPDARGPLLGVLVDADETDLYDYAADREGAEVRKLALDGSSPPADRNGWQWQQQLIADRTVGGAFRFPSNPMSGPLTAAGPAGGAVWGVAQEYPPETPLADEEVPAPPAFGGGVDESTFNRALRELAAAGQDVVDVTLRLTTDPAGLDNVTGSVTGTVYAHVAVESALGPDAVSGVDLITETGLLARADPAGDPGRFVYAWDLVADGARVPDGPHRLVAAARLAVADGAPGRSVESAPKTFRVDSPPLVGLRLDDGLALDHEAVSGRKTAPPPEPLRIDLDVSPDADFPETGGPYSGVPGGTLEVTLVPAGASQPAAVLAPKAYRSAGPLSLTFDGRCGADPCADGLYLVRASLVDAAGAEDVEERALRLDSRAPATQVQLPRHAGETPFKDGFDDLRVSWTLTDHGAPPAGVLTDLLRIESTPSGDRAVVIAANRTHTQTSFVVQDAANETLRFVTVSRDALGNRESPCDDGEPEPCWRAAERAGRVVTTTVDFSPPQIEDLAASTPWIRPDMPVTFTAKVKEENPGLIVLLNILEKEDQLPNGPHPMGALAGKPGQFRYADWGNVTGGLASDEREYTVEAVAIDRAGNRDTRPIDVLLDGLAPRIEAAPTRYYSEASGGGSNPLSGLDPAKRIEVGRAQAYAVVSANITDASLENGLPGIAVLLNASAIDNGTEEAAMKFDPVTGSWAALVALPDGIADGLYDLPMRALDAAGNEGNGTLRVVVDSNLTAIGKLEAVSALHDRVVVQWTTEQNATEQVRYGRAADSLPRSTPVVRAGTKSHTVEVAGLSPNTVYYFQGVSRGANGLENATAPLAVRTASAIDLRLTGASGGGTYGGLLAVSVQATLRTGEEAPVAVAFSAQAENASLRPIPLKDLPAVLDAANATLDLRTLPDGVWTLRVDAFRPGDQATLLVGPLRVDNGAPFLVPLAPGPGSHVRHARPGILVAVGDPGGDPGRDWSANASLRVDGKEVPASVRSYVGDEVPGGTAGLMFTPTGDLADGARLLQAVVADGAGNSARLEWPILVDTSPPRLQAADAEGPEGFPQAPPGGSLEIAVSLSDITPIASASVDLKPLGRDPLPLRLSQGLWRATLALPPDARAGELAFDVAAADRAGNLARFPGAVRVAVDPDAPELGDATATARTTMLLVQATSSEPARAVAEARRDGTVVANATADSFTSTPQLVLAGLDPGTDLTVRIGLVDRAGNLAWTEVPARTLDDTTPPGKPVALLASSPDEGVVRLSWQPPSDDSGIRFYESRIGDGNWTRAADGEAVSARLAAAAGQDAAVALRAVDLAGLAGEAASANLTVLALPHLEEPRALKPSVRVGDSARFEVTYRHAADPPVTVTLHVAGLEVPMERGEGDCRTGCLYAARVQMSATDLVSPASTFHVTADDGLHQASTAPARAPLVLDATQDAPAPGLAMSLALLALAAAFRRRSLP